MRSTIDYTVEFSRDLYAVSTITERGRTVFVIEGLDISGQYFAQIFRKEANSDRYIPENINLPFTRQELLTAENFTIAANIHTYRQPKSLFDFTATTIDKILNFANTSVNQAIDDCKTSISEIPSMCCML